MMTALVGWKTNTDNTIGGHYYTILEEEICMMWWDSCEFQSTKIVKYLILTEVLEKGRDAACCVTMQDLILHKR